MDKYIFKKYTCNNCEKKCEKTKYKTKKIKSKNIDKYSDCLISYCCNYAKKMI